MNFVRFLDRLLHYFRPPKMSSKSCKMKIHFWNHFLPIRRPPIRDNRGTLSPRNPPLFSFQHNATSTPLRCASRHPPTSDPVRSGMIAVPSPPGTPLSFHSSITQRPLRFAALPVIRRPFRPAKSPTILLPNPPPIKEGYRIN